MSCTAFYLQISDALLHCFPALSSAVRKSDDILTPRPSLLPHVSILKKLISFILKGDIKTG